MRETHNQPADWKLNNQKAARFGDKRPARPLPEHDGDGGRGEIWQFRPPCGSRNRQDERNGGEAEEGRRALS